ncbi:MAG: cation:proton antiporter, partial [Pseudomonadota bacterium]
MSWTDHLLLMPVLLPLFSAVAMLLLGGEKRRPQKAALNLIATVALLFIAVALLRQADADPDGARVSVYLLANWPAPFGIVFVLDRLSALMVLLSAVLGLAALLYALARWHRAGSHFHTLFQLQLMGLNGAFLTGDLFNLFVFFEVLLAAS